MGKPPPLRSRALTRAHVYLLASQAMLLLRDLRSQQGMLTRVDGKMDTNPGSLMLLDLAIWEK